MGIFWYGKAPQGLGELPDRVEGEIPLYEKAESKAGCGAGEIWFEGIPQKDLPAMIRSAVARLHSNLHHPATFRFGEVGHHERRMRPGGARGERAAMRHLCSRAEDGACAAGEFAKVRPNQ